jgi:chromosome transmission fidelity protein 4
MKATCTCDGKIVIWNMVTDPPVIEKTLEGIVPVVSDSEYVVCMNMR